MKSPKHPHGRFFRATTFTLLLAGCAGEIAIDEGIDNAKIENRAEWLNVSGMNRDQIIAQIGEPWISDTAHRVDVFRVSEKQHNILLAFAPYPIPLPNFSRRFTGYSLVSYELDGTVESADSAFRVTGLFGMPDNSSAANQAAQKPMARAGDYLFVHTFSGRTILSVSHGRYLSDRANSPGDQESCTVLAVHPALREHPVGRGGALDACWCKARIDDQQSVYLAFLSDAELWNPPAEYSPPEGAATNCLADRAICSFRQRLSVPLALAPGTHQIQFSDRLVRGQTKARLSCAAGELWYAIVSLEEYPSGSSSKGKVSVEFSRELPADRQASRVLLNFNGKWLTGDGINKDY